MHPTTARLCCLLTCEIVNRLKLISALINPPINRRPKALVSFAHHSKNLSTLLLPTKKILRWKFSSFVYHFRFLFFSLKSSTQYIAPIFAHKSPQANESERHFSSKNKSIQMLRKTVLFSFSLSQLSQDHVTDEWAWILSWAHIAIVSLSRQD